MPTSDAPRLWERFLALRNHGPYMLDYKEVERTQSSLRSYTSTAFLYVDAAWIHYYRLYLCASSVSPETLNLKRILVTMTNIKAANDIRLGNPTVILHKPKRSSVAGQRSAALNKYGLNETSLLVEMLMSAGSVRSLALSSCSVHKTPQKTSPFMGYLGDILAANANIETLKLGAGATFRYHDTAFRNRTVGLQGVLRSMRRGTSRLIRVDITAGCGISVGAAKRKVTKRKEEATLEPLYSSFGEHNGYATIDVQPEQVESKSDKARDDGARKEAQASDMGVYMSRQRTLVHESHWSAVATLLVEGISRVPTIRCVSIEDCHLEECSRVLLPAISQMLRLTIGTLHTLRLPGFFFPALRRGSSPSKRKSRHRNLSNKSNNTSAPPSSKLSSSSPTQVFCDALRCATVDPICSLTALDISRATIGNSASVVVSKAIAHMTTVDIQNINATSLGLRCFLRCMAERPKTMNRQRLLLPQRVVEVKDTREEMEEKEEKTTASNVLISTTGRLSRRRLTQQSRVIKSTKIKTKKKKKKKNTIRDNNTILVLQDEGVLLRAIEATRARANTLVELNLSQLGLGQRGGVSLASALRACTCLEWLNLDSNFMSNIGCGALFQGIKPICGKLKHLSLRENLIGDNAAQPLCQLLDSCAALETLILSDNQLTTDSLSLMWSSFGHGRCPSLFHLDVSHNKIDTTLCILQGYRSIRRAMLIAPHGAQQSLSLGLSLESLSLAGNLLTASGACILSDILQLRFIEDDDPKRTNKNKNKNRNRNNSMKSSSEHLTSSMLLRSGPIRSPSRKLSGGRAPSASLTSLDLSHNQIGAEGGQHLGRGLRKSVYLKELLLVNCGLGSIGALSIAKGMIDNMTLETLDMSCNLICCDTRKTYGLELRAVNALAAVIKKSKTLIALMLRDNHLGKSGGEALEQAVMVNRTMIVLDMNLNNGVESKTLKSIEKRLEENARFTFDHSKSSRACRTIATRPRELSSYLSPADKDHYKTVVSPPRTTLSSYSPPSMSNSSVLFASMPPAAPVALVAPVAAPAAPAAPATPTAHLRDFGFLLDAALDVSLEGNIQEREQQRDDDSLLAEILHGVKQRFVSGDVEDSLHTTTRAATNKEKISIRIPSIDRRDCRDRRENLNVSPMSKLTPVRASKIVLSGRSGEQLDQAALQRAIARM